MLAKLHSLESRNPEGEAHFHVSTSCMMVAHGVNIQLLCSAASMDLLFCLELMPGSDATDVQQKVTFT